MIYALAYILLTTVVLAGFVPLPVILGLASVPILPFIRNASTNNPDYVPATSLGVLLYTATGILIVLGYVLSII